MSPPPIDGPLVFRNRSTGSYQRTEDAGMILRKRGRYHWTVALTDSKREHEVVLYYDGGDLYGGCDCRGFKYAPGPCAHLWSIYLGAEFGTVKLRRLEESVGDAPRCPICGEIPADAEVP